MFRKNALAIVLCFLILVGGCTRNQSPVSNGKILQLRRALYSYMIGPGHEPIDSPQNSARILALLKDIEPLDSAEKINVALDVFEYYDATDNLVSSYASEMLVRYERWTLPFIRVRMKSALNPADMRNLIKEIESLHPRPEDTSKNTTGQRPGLNTLDAGRRVGKILIVRKRYKQ